MFIVTEYAALKGEKDPDIIESLKNCSCNNRSNKVVKQIKGNKKYLYKYIYIFIYCMNLHQFLILCSSKAMMFVKLYFRTSDIYLISLVSLDPSGFHLRTK